jgi:hypothetical protein
MKKCTDHYTVRHRLTFTPDEVLDALRKMFPSTIPDVAQITIGDGFDEDVEVSWDEHVAPQETEFKS